MSDKLRPANAAGPNGLRGGIKTYTAKTITGPWLDELGGTAGYKRGFTNSDYETEAQHAQLGAIRTRAPEFGAELPDDIQLNRPSSPFRYQAGGKKENYWATNTQMMSQAMVTHSKDREIATTLKPRLAADKLEAYRRTWTTESDAMRDIRFTTETRRQGGAVGAKYSINSVRSLPGTPKPFETYRAAMIEKYGLFAFTVVRYHMGKAEDVSLRAFRAALKDSGVDMKLFEINQIIAFTTPSTTEMSVTRFMDILKGHVLGFDRHAAVQLFAVITAIADGYQVQTAHILQAIDQQAHPEVAVALEKYADAVYSEGSRWQEDGFVAWMHDLYAANPADHAAAMKSIWRV